MQKLAIAFGLVLSGLSAAALAAAPAPVASVAAPVADTESSQYQLCSSWSYNAQIGGYVCSFHTYVQILDQWDINQLDQTINQLQQQIRSLEMRVQQLENRRP